MSDYAFSGPGDINRADDDDASEGYWEPTSDGERGSTNARSRMWNAAAQDTVTDIPEFGGAYTAPADDDMLNHVYGES